MAKDYEKEALHALRRDPRDAEAWTEWGIGLLKEALRLTPEDALPLLEESARKFRTAVDLVSHEPQYWYNLAAATSLQVSHGNATNDSELLTSAEKLYQNAIRYRPRWHAPWQGWADALFSLGQKEKDPEAVKVLLYQAEVRYAVANELKPDEIDILRSWGLAIILQAESVPEANAPSLWRASSTKFAELLQNDPKHIDAWGYWGVCLYHLAHYCSDKHEAVTLLDSAIRKFDIAIQLAPQGNYSWRWRGATLRRKAESTQGEEKHRLLTESTHHYEKSCHLLPDHALTWMYWGEALYLEAGSLTEPACRDFYHEAALRFAVAAEIEPDNKDVLTNWSIILSHHSMHSPPAQAIPLLEKAITLQDQALKIDPKESRVFINRSFCFRYMSRFFEGNKKVRYLENAASSAERCALLEPTSQEGWYQWGLALLEQATHSSGDVREACMASASEKLDKAEAAKKHCSVYALAGLAALREDSETCHNWLILAEENEDLNSRRYLQGDDAFASVRGEEWFRQLLERMPR